MKVEKVVIDHIDIPSRLRAVDDTKAAALAESIGAIGLQQPITLWAEPDGAFHLVAGAHRLSAARVLGWHDIDAVFMDADDIDRQLWEIDENLMRSELTPTQQAEHLAKRKELWEARKESGRNPPTSRKHFAADTEGNTGVSKRRVNEAVARAEKVPEDIRDEIRGTDLDKGVVLDDLARTAPEKQRERLQEFKTGRASKIDADVKDRAAKSAAETIAEHVPGEWWDGLKANLYAAGAKNVADALTNVTGEAIMDRRYHQGLSG